MHDRMIPTRAPIGMLGALLCTLACGGQSTEPRRTGGTHTSAGDAATSGAPSGHSGGSSAASEPPRGLDAGAPGNYDPGSGASNDGDMFVPPDELEKQHEQLLQAHLRSPSCVKSCAVLDLACDGAGFNDCDLACPGRLADDAKCAPLIEAVYACLAEHVDEAVACNTGVGAPRPRCGACDDPLRTFTQSCGLTLDCQF